MTSHISNIIATWHVSLHCKCPKCSEYVNLLDCADFWDGRDLEIPEQGTQNSCDVNVQCPICDHEFAVDLEY